MIQSKSKWWIFGTVVFVLLVCIGIFYAYHKIRKNYVTAREVHAPIPVKVLSVKKRELSHIIGAQGNAKEFVDVKIIAKIEAPVKSVKVNIGEIVRPKQLLIEFDGTVLLSQLASAKTSLSKASTVLDNSRLNLQRTKELFDQKLVAKVELENAEQNYSTAQAEFDNATYNLTKIKNDVNYLRIKSPITGVIIDRTVNPGEVPAMNSPLLTLGQIDTIFMVAKVPEQNLGDIMPGQKVEVVFDAYPNLTYAGKIYKIDPNINTETRVFLTYIAIDNKKLRVKPGIAGFSRTSIKKEAIAIPNLSVINPTGQRATVFVVDNDNIAHLIEIKIGLVTEGYTEVLSGLKEGDRIVAVGMRGLRDKDKVRIWEGIF